ncbi:MAG: FAD-binding oxidoreductase, partial [Microthrixaceae bacterium]
GGSRVLAHGDMSRHVLGIQAVTADPDATVIGNLSGLRKDNTGPDATRLLIGSGGAFGVITAVAVALTPVPAQRATALVGPLPDTDAIQLLAQLRERLGTGLSAFEVMCPAAVEAGLSIASPSGPVDPGRDPEVLVLAEASGANGCGDSLVDALSSVRINGRQGPPPGSLLPTSEAWALRHAITEGLRSRGEVLGFDLSVRPRDLPALRASVRALVLEQGAEMFVADFGHWGDGGIHANVVIPDSTGTDAEPGLLRSRVYALVTGRFGGSWSAEHGVGPLNADEWAATVGSTEAATLRAFADITDPLRILGHPGLPFG